MKGGTNPSIVNRTLIRKSMLQPEMKRTPTGGTILRPISLGVYECDKLKGRGNPQNKVTIIKQIIDKVFAILPVGLNKHRAIMLISSQPF